MPMHIPSPIAADGSQLDGLARRRRRARRTLLALACFGVLPALAACGADSSAAGGDTEVVSTDATNTATVHGTQPDGETFCDVIHESMAAADAFGDPNTDPADVADAFSRLAELAPDEVHDDVAMVADAMIALAMTPMDDPNALSSAIDVVLSPEVTDATERIGSYAVESCGITPEAWEA